RRNGSWREPFPIVVLPADYEVLIVVARVSKPAGENQFLLIGGEDRKILQGEGINSIAKRPLLIVRFATLIGARKRHTLQHSEGAVQLGLVSLFGSGKQFQHFT